MKMILSTAAVLLLSGCANHLYKGSIQAPDASGQSREVILYWYMTNPFLGSPKGGPATLLTACGTPIQFDQRAEGILYRGSPATDADPDTLQPVADGFTCGKIENLSTFDQSPPQQVQLSISCLPISDDFAVQPRNYIQASDDVYVIDIQEQKEFFWLGGLIAPPQPPACNE